MAISKIILNGVTQVDLTGDTVQADKLMQSYTAHGADGEPITGTSTAIVPSGTKSITENGTGIDVAQYASVDVAVPTGASKNVQVVQGTTRTTSSSMTAIGAELTVSKTGTYDVYWSAFRNNTSSGYTWQSQLYIDGTAHGTANTSFTNNQQNNHLTNVSLTANQKIRVYGSTTRGSSYYISAPTLVIVEA